MSYTNDHFLTDTTKDEKWLVLVGRPSLAASRWRAEARPTAPPSYFPIKLRSYESRPYLRALAFSKSMRARSSSPRFLYNLPRSS